MFNNQYDSDVTVWSPQGRIFQIEYAMKAINIGSATVGLKNKEYAILIAIKRASSGLSSDQKKIIPVDNHVGISYSGITFDARVISTILRSECLSYKYSFDTPHPIGRLVSRLCNKMQLTTQRYDRRPFGVGLLMVGYDENGTHIYQVVPSAACFNCKAMSIGSRSQTARTYLERHLSEFANSTKEELICHGVQALRGSVPNEDLLAMEDKSSLINISIAIVGKNQPFYVYNESETQQFIDLIKVKYPRPLDDEYQPSTSNTELTEDRDQPPPPPPEPTQEPDVDMNP